MMKKEQKNNLSFAFLMLEYPETRGFMKKLNKDMLIRTSASSTGLLFCARHFLDAIIATKPECVEDLINVEKFLICLNIFVAIPLIQHCMKYTKFISNKKYLLEKYNELSNNKTRFKTASKEVVFF